MELLSVNLAVAGPASATGGAGAATDPIGRRLDPGPIRRSPMPGATERRPVSGRAPIDRLGLAGDVRDHRETRDQPAHALYAYPSEHHPFWRTVRAQARVAGWDDPVPPGLFGEQLTTRGLVESQLWIGDRLRGPDCELAVSAPGAAGPAFAAALGFAQAPQLMRQSGWCGFFLAVLGAGTVGAGDRFELVPGPRELELVELFRARVRT